MRELYLGTLFDWEIGEGNGMRLAEKIWMDLQGKVEDAVT